MNPDITPVLIIFSAGILVGLFIGWVIVMVQRVLLWRRLALPPPVPLPRVPTPYLIAARDKYFECQQSIEDNRRLQRQIEGARTHRTFWEEHAQ